jgi:hypothetical protein
LIDQGAGTFCSVQQEAAACQRSDLRRADGGAVTKTLEGIEVGPDNSAVLADQKSQVCSAVFSCCSCSAAAGPCPSRCTPATKTQSLQKLQNRSKTAAATGVWCVTDDDDQIGKSPLGLAAAAPARALHAPPSAEQVHTSKSSLILPENVETACHTHPHKMHKPVLNFGKRPGCEFDSLKSNRCRKRCY